MQAAFATTLLMLVFLLLPLVLAGFWVVSKVLEHTQNNPVAAKALYEHVFLPVFMGKQDQPSAAGFVKSAPAKPSPKMDVES